MMFSNKTNTILINIPGWETKYNKTNKHYSREYKRNIVPIFTHTTSSKILCYITHSDLWSNKMLLIIFCNITKMCITFRTFNKTNNSLLFWKHRLVIFLKINYNKLKHSIRSMLLCLYSKLIEKITVLHIRINKFFYSCIILYNLLYLLAE